MPKTDKKSQRPPADADSSPGRICLFNRQKDLLLSLSEVEQAISFLMDALNISTGEVIFHFVSDWKLRQIHKRFFNNPSSTDCITFPIDPPGDRHNPCPILGEAFVCPKTALAYAKKHEIDPHEELYRYIIHCLLHLIGYDDIAPQDRRKMKRKEKSCLNRLCTSGMINYRK